MSQVERDFIKQVDDLILGAPADILLRLAEIDKKTQLDGKTFYDAYFALPDEDRKKIVVYQSKKD